MYIYIFIYSQSHDTRMSVEAGTQRHCGEECGHLLCTSNAQCARAGVTRRKQQRPGIATNGNTTHVLTIRSSADLTKPNHTPTRHTRAEKKLILQMATPQAASSQRTHVSRTEGRGRLHPVIRRVTTQYLHRASQPVEGDTRRKLQTPGNGTQKTRNTYNQPNRPNRKTSQTKHQAQPKGQPGRRITQINTATVHASAQQRPTISTHTRQGHHQIFSANVARCKAQEQYRWAG